MLYHQNYVTTKLHAPSGDKAVIIIDGTYIFIEKSSKIQFQKITYSMHKKSNLIKPFMIVYPDGFIAAVCGPYPGNKSDATIMNEFLEKIFFHIFEPEDVFLVDRGFRDSLQLIENKGFIAKCQLLLIIHLHH